ncbi:MAG TPA: sigma-70 family RNA polymerase sigma factor [Thermomicrobiales bacterium]|nr:sigma-70 family RNA polymerase sigma factor [Thermomicrobiales bacterium]
MAVTIRSTRSWSDEARTESADDALVARAATDRQAFALLYDRYVDAVYRYAYSRLRDRIAAEDATSLVFLKALAALPAYRAGSFRAWLFAIVHNVLCDDRRAARGDRPLADGFDLEDRSPRPEDAAIAAEERRSVLRAVALLPEEQRRVVELRLAGLTGPEIARVLGRSHAAVRMTQSRAIGRLRRLLGDETGREETYDGR